EEVTQALTAVLESPRLFFSGRLAPLLSRLPLRGARRPRAARQRLQEIVGRMIAEHRQPGRERSDLLSVLLRLQKEQGPAAGLSDDMIRDNVLNLFLAGHETSANGLTWCWYLMAQNPSVQDILYAELERVLAGRLPTAADVPALTYTEMVFAE